MKSITSVYKIGNGPSSSHTVGPFHAAETFGSRYPDADAYEVTLYGSLAFTGEGHGTGKAIQEGLPGAKILFDRETTVRYHHDDELMDSLPNRGVMGRNDRKSVVNTRFGGGPRQSL